MVGTWLVVGLAMVVIASGLARRIGPRLAREEGLADKDAAPPSGS